MMVNSIVGGETPAEFDWLFFAWLAFALFAVTGALVRGVVRVVVDGDMLTFRTPLRTIEVPVADVVSVETSWWDLNRFSQLIRYTGGRSACSAPSTSSMTYWPVSSR
jgi:hypothetical protein